MNKVIEKIEIDKEILSTMPKNNKKNLLKYIDKINELKEEYNLLSEELYNDMNKRYKKIISVKQNPIIKENSIAISEIEELLEIIDTVKTSYEKIGMDKIIYKLGRFYKENLENINIEILNFLNKFNSIGIKLTCEDFDYSLYVYEYMKVFFQNIEDINSKEIKEKF